MKVIALVNQKGGVAKTTSTLNIGAALARSGEKVLLVDLDPQGSLTKCAGFKGKISTEPTTYEVIKGDADINDAVVSKKSDDFSYDLLLTDIRMSGAELSLISVPGRDMLLKDAIGDLKKKYDYVLIDCGPSLSIFTLMALTASDSMIIPLSAQYMPLEGMAQLMDTVEIVRKRLNPNLDILGAVVTMYDSRRNLDKDVLNMVRETFPDKIFETVIDINVTVSEAPAFGKDIFEYDPTCRGAKQYEQLAAEIVKRCKK